MDCLTIQEIVTGTGGTLLRGDETAVITNVSTDSRAAGPKDLFVPLIGEVHDAHKFIPGAFENGCRTFLVSKEEAAPAEGNVILVSDTLLAMQKLSKYYLDKLDIRRIAVTGSVGKTSTRDMMYYILSEKGKTGRPQKNYNNTIGVPLTVFSFDSHMEYAVFEEGMDCFGMIHDETEITRPEVAVITNIGISHMERLGSRENIFKAKMEITDYFGPENTLVINASNDILKEASFSGEYPVIRVGYEEGLDYVVDQVEDLGVEGVRFRLKTGDKVYPVYLPVPGAHNALNAALAIAGCRAFVDITVEEAIQGLEKLDLTGKRLRVRKGENITVIDDSYNAAPESMESALRTLSKAGGARQIAILGGMNELGEGSETQHWNVGAYAAKQGISLVIGVGEKGKAISEGAEASGGKARWYPSNEALFEELGQIIEAGDMILTKGSNAMHLDQVADWLLNEGER